VTRDQRHDWLRKQWWSPVLAAFLLFWWLVIGLGVLAHLAYQTYRLQTHGRVT
jgi:hypothetical protein